MNSSDNAVFQAPSGMNRRAFLKTSTLASAAALTLTPALMRAAVGANDKIRLGMIGVGTRGGYHLGQLADLAGKENFEIAAVCDVWKNNLASAVKVIKTKLGNEPRTFTRYADLLALKDVDAVVIATPDFSHGPILTDSLKADKDVFIEKPMTIDLAYANEALDLARSRNRIVQAGTQRRSEGNFKGAAKLFATGLLGQVTRVEAGMFFNETRWARPFNSCKEGDVDWAAFLLDLPKRPFDARLLRQWQLFRETSNGLPGLWMTHYADVVHMVTGAKFPTSAVAAGDVYVWKDGRETSDTFHALVNYPEGFLFDWGMGLGNSAGVHFTIHGTKGTMDLEKWTVSPEGGVDTTVVGAPIKAEPEESHMGNFLQCVRSRKLPNADIAYGHQHAVATIMTAKALQTGQRQKYDPATRTIISG